MLQRGEFFGIQVAQSKLIPANIMSRAIVPQKNKKVLYHAIGGSLRVVDVGKLSGHLRLEKCQRRSSTVLATLVDARECSGRVAGYTFF